MSTQDQVINIIANVLEEVVQDRGHNIAFVGNNIRCYKSIDDFFVCGEKFQNITFHIVGEGISYDEAGGIKKSGLANCIYYGLMNHAQLAALLKDMNLHIFPFHSESFSKVAFEAAAMVVSSVVYDDYGTTEWITTDRQERFCSEYY